MTILNNFDNFKLMRKWSMYILCPISFSTIVYRYTHVLLFSMSVPLYEWIIHHPPFFLHFHVYGHLRSFSIRASVNNVLWTFLYDFSCRCVFLFLTIYLKAEFLGNKGDVYFTFWETDNECSKAFVPSVVGKIKPISRHLKPNPWNLWINTL